MSRKMNLAAALLAMLLLIAASASSQTHSPTPCAQPPSGMVAWWPLNETALATSFQDIIGGNNGTPFASPVGAGQAPQPVPGEVGGAMYFPKLGNGLSGARVSPQGALANIGAANFTIDAWVQVPPGPLNRLHYIVNKFDDAQKKGYALYVVSPGVTGNERLEFKWGDGTSVSTVQTISSLTTGQWHHVAVTFARNVGGFALDIRLYVDGAQQGQQTGNPPGLSSLMNFVSLEIGWQPGTIDEPITIDELEIFDRALLVSEIQSIVNAGSLGKCLRPTCAAITINPASLMFPTWSANVDYPQLNLTVTGGIGPRTFTVSGGALPPGMILDSDGTLHGKPATRGTYDFIVTVSDAKGCLGVRMYRLSIISCPAIAMNPATIPSATAGVPYKQSLAASGGAMPYTFIASDGSLPAGLTISSAGTLSGTPTQSGTFTAVINVTDANGCTSQRTYRLIIKPCTSCNLVDLFSVEAVNLQPNQVARYNYFATLKSTSSIRATKLTAEPALSKTLRLSLFPDDVYDVVLDRIDRRADGSYTWKGTIQGQPGNVILVVQGNQITGWVWVGHATKGVRYFSITSLGGGLHVIRKTDQAWFDSISPGCNTTGATTPAGGSPLTIEPFDPADNRKTSSGKVMPKIPVPQKTMPNAVASECTIDVLVVYTQAAKNAHGNIPALAQLAVDQVNTTYANSGVTGLALNLKETMEVDYTESDTLTGGSSDDLLRLQDTSDGILDDVDAKRDSVGADVVVLIVNDLTNVGLYGEAATIGAEFETAFAVVDWEAATDNLTFAHELGHLQGAQHHDDPTITPYEYAHGSCRPGPANYKTIMGTVDCYEPSVPYWSSPDVIYNAQSTGDQTYRDNARVLRETACTMAGLAEIRKCPFPHEALTGLINGRTICLSKPDSTIQRHNCSDGGHFIEGKEFCVVEEKKRHVRVRQVVADICPDLTMKLEGQNNGRIVCRSVVDPKIQTHTCADQGKQVWGNYCLMEESSWYVKVKSLKADLCPDLTNKLAGQSNAGRIVCRSVTVPKIQAKNCADQGKQIWNSPWGNYCLMGESSWHVNVKDLKEDLCPDLTNKLEGQYNAGRIVCQSVVDPQIQAHICAEQGKQVWNSPWGNYCLMGESGWHVNVKNLKEDLCPWGREKVGTSSGHIMCKELPHFSIKRNKCGSVSQDGNWCLTDFKDNYWYKVRRIN